MTPEVDTLRLHYLKVRAEASAAKGIAGAAYSAWQTAADSVMVNRFRAMGGEMHCTRVRLRDSDGIGIDMSDGPYIVTGWWHTPWSDITAAYVRDPDSTIHARAVDFARIVISQEDNQ